mmetsp:Transcript_27375/g.49278  ORF Transcript_27375/g.49278 Transcript_27375/m.49278 type:complete len:449 (+) Transcript_27375:91-1437(+)
MEVYSKISDSASFTEFSDRSSSDEELGRAIEEHKHNLHPSSDQNRNPGLSIAYRKLEEVPKKSSLEIFHKSQEEIDSQEVMSRCEGSTIYKYSFLEASTQSESRDQKVQKKEVIQAYQGQLATSVQKSIAMRLERIEVNYNARNLEVRRGIMYDVAEILSDVDSLPYTLPVQAKPSYNFYFCFTVLESIRRCWKYIKQAFSEEVKQSVVEYKQHLLKHSLTRVNIQDSLHMRALTAVRDLCYIDNGWEGHENVIDDLRKKRFNSLNEAELTFGTLLELAMVMNLCDKLADMYQSYPKYSENFATNSVSAAKLCIEALKRGYCDEFLNSLEFCEKAFDYLYIGVFLKLPQKRDSNKFDVESYRESIETHRFIAAKLANQLRIDAGKLYEYGLREYRKSFRINPGTKEDAILKLHKSKGSQDEFTSSNHQDSMNFNTQTSSLRNSGLADN